MNTFHQPVFYMAKIEIIITGYFYADGGAMFGAIPKSAWSHKYPSNPDNGCVLAMKSLLISSSSGRKILVDTGCGYKHLKQLSYYHFFGLKDLRMALAGARTQPEEITDVVLTHLHFDHCGFCTYAQEDGLHMAFPNANHWVSRRQWDNFCHPNALEKDSFFDEDMRLVSETGKLSLVETNLRLAPDVNLSLCDGHTPGQIVPFVETDNGQVVFAGDVIPLISNVSPAWISAYDVEPLCSYEEKSRLLELAAQENLRIIYCHDAYFCSSQIVKTDSGLFLPARNSIIKEGKLPL